MNILTASRLFTFVPEGTMYEISTACFIYRSIFAVQALRKRRVQGHCAAYHFRTSIHLPPYKLDVLKITYFNKVL